MREGDFEDCVGPAALLVHVGGSNCARLVTLRHQRLDILEGDKSQTLVSTSRCKHGNSATLQNAVQTSLLSQQCLEFPFGFCNEY